jgi:transcriptional regulator with XRE-family HTH domain
MSYGRFLQEVRRSRLLSQSDLAATTGISQPNLSAYENDRRAPTIDVLNRILVACGYQLVADAGQARVRCPLPVAGWFPDDDLPPPLPDDPVAASEPAPPGSPQERGRSVYEALRLGEATQ